MDAVNVMIHPKESIKQIENNFKKILTAPKAVWNSMSSKVTNYVDTNITNGNTHTRAEFGTHAVIFVGSFLTGGSEVKAGTAASKFAQRTEELLSKAKGLTSRVIHEETGSINIFNRMFSKIVENEMPAVDRGIAGFSEAGASEVNSLNPNKINFSQRSVSESVVKYTEDMKLGNWDWSRSGPLKVMERDGKWVSGCLRG